MKELSTYISPFRLLALAIFLFAIWWCSNAGNGGPHGYAILFGGILFFLAVVIFLLDALISAVCRNATSVSYLIQLGVIAIIVGWIYFKNS